MSAVSVVSAVSGVRFVVSNQKPEATYQQLAPVRRPPGVVLSPKMMILKAARRRLAGLGVVAVAVAVAVAPAGANPRGRQVANVGEGKICDPSGEQETGLVGDGLEPLTDFQARHLDDCGEFLY